MKPIRLELVDGAILGVYFAFVLGIGFVLKRHMRTSSDFFLSGRLIPTWVAGLAFLSANLGAQDGNRAGVNRDGCIRGEVRNHDQPSLLGRRYSRYGLRRRVHDAV